jgi:hypothetical protein
MIAQTIPELTNYEYNELCYSSTLSPIKGKFMYRICDLLNKCSFEVTKTDEYNHHISATVTEFQKMAGITPTGILNTNTLQAMILYADSLNNDIVESEDDEEINATTKELTGLPHYDSFFGDEKYKTHRRNRKDIKIVFGNKSVTKTIKNVFMLGVSVEVDTSGNPISEIYEFIAQDVVESDEITDTNKYSEIEHATTSDVQYDFSSIRVK